MLAVKLHRKKKPWLGKGSHLVPVLSWKLARVRIKNWIRILESGWRGENHTIRYITLVRIPDDHAVALQQDWIDKQVGIYSGQAAQEDGHGNLVFPTLDDVPDTWKRPLLRWDDGDDLGPYHPVPELILGAPLPRSKVLWTKSRLLLYRGDRRDR